MFRIAIVALAISVSAPACKKDEPGTATPPLSATAPATAPADPGPPPATPAASGAPVGEVLETMDSGGYTYALLDSGSDKVWIAGPETKLSVGDAVTTSGSTPMHNFRSNTLERTFEVIHFVTAINGGGAPAAPADPHAGIARTAAPIMVEKLAPPAGGTSVADVFAGKAKLAGKPVAVRGKVVKYSGGILGKNWIHLRDGSGAEGTNDLTVTTDATARVGDTVVVRGKVSIDKDFGAGYRYDVIVEDATLTVE